jgi:hypothetical protein
LAVANVSVNLVSLDLAVKLPAIALAARVFLETPPASAKQDLLETGLELAATNVFLDSLVTTAT